VGTITELRAAALQGPAARPRRFAFWRTPLPCRLWVAVTLLAALLLPFWLRPLGHAHTANSELLTGLMLVLVSVLNVELGRLLEGGVSAAQRPHKALSAWAFASALLLPTWWLLPVVAVSYSHAWWRGLRVPVWKWVGSAAFIVLAGLAGGLTAHAVLGNQPNMMDGDGLRGLLAVVLSATAFLAVETALFHGTAYLNIPSDEAWLRQTLRSLSFYLTEAGVLLVGGLSAAIWTGGPWFVALLLPVYALIQRAALHEPLRERAEQDEKTGLLRYESWRRVAVTASERCSRRGQPWSVLFADLDHFKRFNDSWGHLAGDDALVAVAEALRTELRAADIIGRFGGEEFCVFLPDIGADEAASIAERMRLAVCTMDVPHARAVTISIGVATVEAEEQVELVVALTAADKALFEAKTGGRNTTRQQLIAQ